MRNRLFSVSLAIVWFGTTIFGSRAAAITISTVPVGNPGNAGEAQLGGVFGSVGYEYRIGKYEVTNAQYTEFLNAVDPTGVNTLALWNGFMVTSDSLGGIVRNTGAAIGSKYAIKPGRADNPVNYVSWYDSLRFTNWLHNGGGIGANTEDGAYTLLGGTPTPSNGTSVTRNAGAQWWLPNENEWYKAAYHKNDGVTGNYWEYPTSTDGVPFSDQPPGSGAPIQSNTANVFNDDGIANGYNDGYAVTGSNSLDPFLNYLTNVGAYTLSVSPYGTFDQGGNVIEWNESVLFETFRGHRGGMWSPNEIYMRASFRDYVDEPSFERNLIGFRVASAAIPEPSAFLLIITSPGALLVRRRKSVTHNRV